MGEGLWVLRSCRNQLQLPFIVLNFDSKDTLNACMRCEETALHCISLWKNRRMELECGSRKRGAEDARALKCVYILITGWNIVLTAVTLIEKKEEKRELFLNEFGKKRKSLPTFGLRNKKKHDLHDTCRKTYASTSR